MNKYNPMQDHKFIKSKDFPRACAICEYGRKYHIVDTNNNGGSLNGGGGGYVIHPIGDIKIDHTEDVLAKVYSTEANLTTNLTTNDTDLTTEDDIQYVAHCRTCTCRI